MKQRGFTLLEIAVGMAVLGLGVVSALQVFGSSIQLERAAGRKSEAVMHARALMDSVLWAPELVANVSHGEIGDGFRWERVIRPATPEDMPGIQQDEQGGDSDLGLAVISVTVQWNETTGVKSFSIGTMRVVPGNSEHG